MEPCTSSCSRDRRRCNGDVSRVARVGETPVVRWCGRAHDHPAPRRSDGVGDARENISVRRRHGPAREPSAIPSSAYSGAGSAASCSGCSGAGGNGGRARRGVHRLQHRGRRGRRRSADGHRWPHSAVDDDQGVMPWHITTRASAALTDCAIGATLELQSAQRSAFRFESTRCARPASTSSPVSSSDRVSARRYTGFVSRWHTRATCVAVAIVLAGMPAGAAACALACSHSMGHGNGVSSGHQSDSEPGSSRIDHSHHQRKPDTTPVAIDAACHQRCCDETTFSAVSSIATRIDATVSPASTVCVAGNATKPRLPVTTGSRRAPPGRSHPAALSLPLRI